MRKKIFRSILVTSLAALLISLLAATGALYQYFVRIQEHQLHRELKLTARAVEDSGLVYLESLDADNLRVRITWINADGAVIYDTEAVAGEMENHADREEVRKALKYGEGSSSRRSATLTETTIYHAVKLNDGTVLRVAVSHATIIALIGGIIPMFVLAAIIVAVLAWLIAKRMTRNIVAPLDHVDLERPLENDTYEELSPFLMRIHRLHEQSENQLAQLRQKADEFNHITANMKESLVLLDEKGVILSINPAATMLFSTSQNAVGLDFLSVDRSHEISNAIHAAKSQGHAVTRVERNGRIYQFDISRIESGNEIIGLVILAFDISEQEYAERTRREFSANVSHELKTPLTSIIASAELIKNNLVKPEDMPRFVGHIHQEASRLLSLIEDIIRLSQLDEGQDIPRETVDLGALATEVVDQLRDTADKNNVRINVSADECLLQGVPRLLHEIVYNLVGNAIKYNVDGGKVDVSVTKTQTGGVLKVSDTGIGIPFEHQHRVFERFYRVDKSHSKLSGGTGLGLSIVKHAAAYSGAGIALQSAPGKGTTITVTFYSRP